MLIKNVIVRVLEIQLGGKLRNARKKWDRKLLCFAFVEGEDGSLGVGEGWTSYGSAHALAATIKEDLAPLIVGRPVWDTPHLVEVSRRSVDMSGRAGIMSAACAAVEMAMWDLWAKTLGQPVSRLFGIHRDRIPVYASAGLYADGKGIAGLETEIAGYVQQGFTSVKIKVGGAPHSEDVRRVAAARNAAGPDVSVMVDAHYMMDVPRALAFARAIEPYDITWLEAPIPPSDFDGYAALSARSPVPICGSETLPLVADFNRLLADRGASYVMFDLSTCGGFIEGRRIADAAHAAYLPVTLHSSSSVVLMLANLHFAASIPNMHSCEFHMMHRWLFDYLPGDPFKLQDGCIAVPSLPGIGITLTPDDEIFINQLHAASESKTDDAA